MVGVAVNVTGVPKQILVDVAVMLTEAAKIGLIEITADPVISLGQPLEASIPITV